MTIDERFERIEHFTAGEAEQRRQDREADRALWRDTQLQLNELTFKLAQLSDRMAASEDRSDRMEAEFREADRRLGERIDEADRKLGERIASLVSAMGEFFARMDRQAKGE